MHKLAIIMLALAMPAAGQAPYRHHGQALLPNAAITPGVLNRKVDQKVSCATKWGRDARHVTDSMKQQVFHRYDIETWYLLRGKRKILMCSKTQRCSELYEIDHLQCRENGGADDVRNLWPQPWVAPGAHEKDQVENWLHKQVCSGAMPLESAQQLIAADWYAVYELMIKEKRAKR